MKNWEFYYLNQGYSHEARERCKRLFRHLSLDVVRTPLPNEPYYEERRLRRKPRERERTLALALAQCLRRAVPSCAGVVVTQDRITVAQMKTLLAGLAGETGVRMISHEDRLTSLGDMTGIAVCPDAIPQVLAGIRTALRLGDFAKFIAWLSRGAEVGVWS